jgi:hypothetical protein
LSVAGLYPESDAGYAALCSRLATFTRAWILNMLDLRISAVLLCAVLSCSISNPAKDNSPTPFDNSAFSGHYQYAGSEKAYWFTGRFASNGKLSELGIEQEGALAPGGFVSDSGVANFRGEAKNISHVFKMTFSGSMYMSEDYGHYEGSGVWNGTIQNSVSDSSVAGTWVIEYGAIIAGNGAAGVSQFLCWTGSTHDSLREFMLLRMNGVTGAVSVVGGSDFYTELVYGPDSTLYGIGSCISKIDPNTGEAISMGNLRLPDSSGYILMAGAEFSPEGVLYVLENGGSNRVFTVDTATGILTYLCIAGSIGRDFAISRHGTFYGINNDLFVLNPVSFAVTDIIGSVGVSIGGSLFFTPDGALIGCDIYPSENVYSIDVLTGKPTKLFTPGSTGISATVEERIMPETTLKARKSAYPPSPHHDREYLARLEWLYRRGQSTVDF